MLKYSLICNMYCNFVHTHMILGGRAAILRGRGSGVSSSGWSVWLSFGVQYWNQSARAVNRGSEAWSASGCLLGSPGWIWLWAGLWLGGTMRHYTANSNSSTEQTIYCTGWTDSAAGPRAATNGTGQWRLGSDISWPTHHGPDSSWWIRSNHHAGTCVWDTGFAADTVGPTRTDPDPGWAGWASTGPVGPDRADHHPAAQMAVTAGQTQTQQQIALQGQQVAQTAEGQTIVYQPVNGDGTIFHQGMITIPTASLAGAHIVHMEADTNTTSSGQGTDCYCDISGGRQCG